MKIFRKLHLILGIVIGIMFIFLCLTGFTISLATVLSSGPDSFWGRVLTSATQFHKNLMMSDVPIGKLIVGISSIAFIVVIITGIIISFPKQAKYWKSMFTMKWKKGYILHTIHVVLGMYVSLWLIVLATTGIFWSFPSFTEKLGQTLNIQNVPEMFRYQEVTNPETNEVQKVDLLPGMSYRERVLCYAKLIHLGKWGGGFGEVLNVIAVLVGVTLPITGLIIYIRRIRKRRK